MSRAYFVLSSTLMDQYDENDMPVFMHVARALNSAILTTPDVFEKWEDAERAAVLLGVLVARSNGTLEYAAVKEIDEELSLAFKRIVGMPGQTAAEREVAIERCPIAKWAVEMLALIEPRVEDHSPDH